MFSRLVLLTLRRTVKSSLNNVYIQHRPLSTRTNTLLSSHNGSLRFCESTRNVNMNRNNLYKFPNFQVRTMFIQTETTPNQDSLKFKPGISVMPDGGTAEFLSGNSATTSPLAKKLFQIDGVRGVFFGPDFITISKDQDTPWQLMKPDIYADIMDFFSSGQPILTEAQPPSDTEIKDDDPEVVQMIKELLDTRIRPAIQEDGGDIEYRGFDNGIVKLKLKGDRKSVV